MIDNMDTVDLGSMFDEQKEKQETCVNVLRAEVDAIERSDSMLCEGERQVLECAAQIIEEKVMK